MGDNAGAPSMGRKLLSAGASATRFAGRFMLSTASRAWSGGIAVPVPQEAPVPAAQIPAAVQADLVPPAEEPIAVQAAPPAPAVAVPAEEFPPLVVPPPAPLPEPVAPPPPAVFAAPPPPPVFTPAAALAPPPEPAPVFIAPVPAPAPPAPLPMYTPLPAPQPVTFAAPAYEPPPLVAYAPPPPPAPGVAAAPLPLSPAPHGLSADFAAVLEAKQKEGFSHGDYAAIMAALASNANAAAAAEASARTPGAPVGLLSPVEAAAAAASSQRTPYSAARAVLHAAALQPLRPRLASPALPVDAAMREAADPYAMTSYGYGMASQQAPSPVQPVYAYTPQRTPRAAPAAVPEWLGAARGGGGATPGSLKRPFADVAPPPPAYYPSYSGGGGYNTAGAYADGLALAMPGDARDVRRRTDGGEYSGAVTPPVAPRPVSYDMPRASYGGAGPTAAGTTETAAKILETLRQLAGAAGPSGGAWPAGDPARAPLMARTPPPPPPPTGSLTEVTPPMRPAPVAANALSVERAAAMVVRRPPPQQMQPQPQPVAQQQWQAPPQQQQAARAAAPPSPAANPFVFGVPTGASAAPPARPAPPAAAPKPSPPPFVSPWGAAASAPSVEAVMEDSESDDDEDAAAQFTFTAPAVGRALPAVATGRVFDFPAPGTAAPAGVLPEMFTFTFKPLTPEGERQQRLMDAYKDVPFDGPAPRYIFGGEASAAPSPAGAPAASAGGGGGWDASFLARNASQSVATTKAIEAEIAKAKGGSATPSAPAAPAAPAAGGGGGWDPAFLSRNAASTQAAVKAIEAEIEKAKGGGAPAKPAQQFTFGVPS